MKALYIFQRSRTEILGGHDSVTSPASFFSEVFRLFVEALIQ